MSLRSLIFALVTSAGVTTQAPAGTFAYVANATGSSISIYAVDRNSGALAPISGSPFPDPFCGPPLGSCPVWVAAHPSGRFLYVTEAQERKVSGFSIDPTTGALNAIPGASVFVGGITQSITVAPSGNFAYAVSVDSGSISGFTIDPATGSLMQMPGPAFPSVSGAYISTFHPTGRFLYVGTTSGIFVFTIDISTGVLTLMPGSPFPGGIRAAVHPNGLFLYTGGEFTSGIGYRIDPLTGALTPISDSAFNIGRGLEIEPSGRFLYTAVGPGSDSVYGYAIDSTTGSLSLLPGFPLQAGLHAGWTALDPTGRFLYVTNTHADSSNISAYRIDSVSGSLTAISGSPFPNGLGPQGITIVQTVRPFSSFSAWVSVDQRRNTFAAAGQFTLGADNDGIAPPTEPIRLSVGTFSVNIEAGSFQQDRQGSFFFVAQLPGGQRIAMGIQPMGGANYGFGAVVQGTIPGTSSPVHVELIIGDDGGSTTASAHFN